MFPEPRQQTGGVATGESRAAVRDAQSRVITAGGFVDNAPVIYQDATVKSGLASFENVSGGAKKSYIVEVSGQGVAVLDFDNDGWQDIYLLNGGTFDAVMGKEAFPGAALFRNNRNGTFSDVTKEAGVENGRWGYGVSAGDFNNDGWPDLYVTNFGRARLYRNSGKGTYTDVAESAGVALNGWYAGSSFGDYDADGDLDLFVAGYVVFDLEHLPDPGSEVVAGNYCRYRGQPVMCGPKGLEGLGDHLFRNNGDGTFTDVSEKAGVSDPEGFYGFGAMFVDVNDDGKLDIAVANDSTGNFLYLNKGDGTFENASYASGFALNEGGREQAGMGIAAGDYTNTGRMSLFVSNFSDDYNTLYTNEGDGNFSDLSFQSGVAEASIPFLGWGANFLDFDNDGWQDIFVANGHVYPEVDREDWGTTFAQRPLLFRNLKRGKFEAVTPATNSGLAVLKSARGSAIADFMNRGKLDVIINNVDSSPTLLKNVSKGVNNWVKFQLAGGEKSPRDAIGAKAYLTAGGTRQRQDVISGGSYNSSSDLRLHFGLGTAKRVDKLEIHWPSGRVETARVPAVNQIFMVREGSGIAEPAKVTQTQKAASLPPKPQPR